MHPPRLGGSGPDAVVQQMSTRLEFVLVSASFTLCVLLVGISWGLATGFVVAAAFLAGCTAAGLVLRSQVRPYVTEPASGAAPASVATESEPRAEAEVQGTGVVAAALLGRERTVLEEQRRVAIEASSIKTEYLAKLSHEIRTPMTGIIGMAELLMETDLTQDQRDYGKTIQGSAKELLATLNDILDFSKMQSGRLELDCKPFRVDECVDSVVDLLFPRAQEKGLDFTCLIDPDVPSRLVGDAGRVRQVLLNVGGNAIKFTDAGSVHLHVQLLERGEDGALVRLYVEDTGVGIREDRRAAIFQPFTQIDPDANRKQSGSGLGLTISRQLAETMGGTLDFESQVGRGSRFWAELRLGVASDDAPTEDDAVLRGLSALVVDDSAGSREVVRAYCESWGMTVQGASCGSEAIARLSEARAAGRPIDVALIDVEMPDVDGKEIAAQIKSDQSLRSTKLVLLKLRGRSERPSSMVRAGFDAWVSKPVGAQRLRTALLHVAAEPVHGTLAAVTPTRWNQAPSEQRYDASVLLVEDNVVNQKVATLLLKSFGCTVTVADNGLRAIEAMKRRRYDLVFMDCQMPVMTGFEATRVVRSLDDSRARSVPIVAMTANAMPGDRERCLLEGMNDYLSKPVQKDAIETMLRKWAAKTRTSATTADDRAMHEADDLDILDRDVIASLRELGGDDDPELFTELVELFLSDTPGRLRDLVDALEAGDTSALERAAHALKSSSANLGAVGLSALFREIEQAGRDQDLDAAGDLVRRSGEEFSRVEDALKAEMG